MSASIRNIPEDPVNPSSYVRLLDGEEDASIPSNGRRSVSRTLALAFSGLLLLALGLFLSGTIDGQEEKPDMNGGVSRFDIGRGVSEGVSEKSVRMFLGAEKQYTWTNAMLEWQRTAFHFQPEKNWMNDPNELEKVMKGWNRHLVGPVSVPTTGITATAARGKLASGPLFYKGWYHFFYQYNPDSAIWGNITWGHAVSTDLIHWRHLPLAMVPDRWYDANGVWTGSATLLPNGSIVMLYTTSTNEHVQVQNLAYPTNLSDPLLISWTKYDGNPILLPPPGIGPKDFRDPTTGWLAPDGMWRITIGSKVNKTGVSLVYKTLDFISFEIVDEVMHAVPGTGMWECVDFYPVSMSGKNGLDTSVNGLGVKHVLKASLDDDKNDYYAIGMYDHEKDRWTPDNAELDVGIGIRYDYGHFYASKTFYDQNKERRVLWGWIRETDSEKTDIEKGWASLQGIPRVVLFDEKTGSNLLQWPVEEVERLRMSSKDFHNIQIPAGSVVPLDVGMATQLDINAEFEISREALEGTIEADVGYNCSSSNGAAGRGMLGPFGLLVLADQGLSEQMAVYFYIGRGADGNLRTFFCHDELRSSKANDIVKSVYGSTVPVLDGEKLSVRILVDHSIVESFAQGGRTCITSRIYPTVAIYAAARVFLFNNATGADVTATSLKIWQMNSAFISPFSV